jgi:hypothetical protein
MAKPQKIGFFKKLLPRKAGGNNSGSARSSNLIRVSSEQPLATKEQIFSGMLAEQTEDVLDLFKGETSESGARIEEVKKIFLLKEYVLRFDSERIRRQMNVQAFKLIELCFEEICERIGLKIEICERKLYHYQKEEHFFMVASGGVNLNGLGVNSKIDFYRIPAGILLKLEELRQELEKHNNLSDIFKCIYIGHDITDDRKLHLHFNVGLATYCLKEKWPSEHNTIRA